MTMAKHCLTLAGVVIALGIAACGSAAPVSVATATGSSGTPKTAIVVKAAYPDACIAKADGKAGRWVLAETAWGNAETEAKNDIGATFAFASVGLDTVTPALDQGLSQPVSATDIATYNKDLAAASKYITGC